jgi:Tol biopolymer transport system component
MTYRPICTIFALALCLLAAACGRWEWRGSDEVILAFEWEEFGEVPGPVPLVFAPGLVSGDLSSHGYPAFSRDGKSVYWSAYAGSFRNQKIYYMDYSGGGWTSPEVAVFSGEFADGCPVFSPDGERLYFNSARPIGPGDEGGRGYVYMLDRDGPGWSEERPLGPAVNSGRVSMQVAVTESGAVYFAAWRGQRQDADIYVSRLSGERYGEPERLGGGVNSGQQDITPYVAPDESYLLFASVGRGDCLGGADLYVSFRKPTGEWTTARNLGEPVNTSGMEAFCGVSPDGRFLFFNSDRGGSDRVYWVSVGVIDSLRSEERELGQSAAMRILEIMAGRGINEATEEAERMWGSREDEYYFEENEFVSGGYRLMGEGRIDEAVAVLEIAVQRFPDAWNAWDSLGEAYRYAGEKELSVRSYEKSLELNPDNENAFWALEKMDGRIEDMRNETREVARCKPGENTGLTGPYLGQDPPGLEPEVFAPGIVSTRGNLEYSCSFTPDGREMYFNRGGRIMVCYLTEEGWTAPEMPAFAREHGGFEVHITPDGRRLFFNHGRDIWVMEKNGDGWGEPVTLWPGMFVSTTREGTVYVTDMSPEHEFGVIVRRRLSGGDYSDAEMLEEPVNGGGAAHPCISPDESFIVFDSWRPGGFGQADFYVCFREPDGSWTGARNLGEGISTVGENICATLSPDGKFLFFTANNDIYWVSREVLERLRP